MKSLYYTYYIRLKNMLLYIGYQYCLSKCINNTNHKSNH